MVFQLNLKLQLTIACKLKQERARRRVWGNKEEKTLQLYSYIHITESGFINDLENQENIWKNIIFYYFWE